MQIVSIEQLMDLRNLEEGFIKHHARRMGSFGKPRRFILETVDKYLVELSQQAQKRGAIRQIEQYRKGRDLVEVANKVFTQRRKAKKKGR